MTRLIIEDVDEVVMDGLSRLAARNRLSIEDQTRILLQRFVSGRDPEALVRRAEEIAAMTPHGVTQTDSVLLLREERDR